jgi:hypothetical protein
MLTVVLYQEKSLVRDFVDLFKLADNSKHKTGQYILLIALTIFVLLPVLALILCASPYLFYVKILRKEKSKSTYTPDPKKINRPYIPMYAELFFSLTEKYEPFKPLFNQFLKKYNASNCVAFPIIFNQNDDEDLLFESKLRKSLHEQGVSFFIFNMKEFHDVPLNTEMNQEVIDFYTSDSNFSFIPLHPDASASALSILLDIPIDGINKMVVVRKDNPNELIILNMNEITEDFLASNMDDMNSSKIHLERPFYNAIAEYLSLQWSGSKLDENKPIKECASEIRSRLYERYKIAEPSVLTIFMLAEKSPGPIVMFKTLAPSDEEMEIRNIILWKSYNEILSMYPSFDVSTLNRLKEFELDLKLRDLTNLEGLEYESKIFLKSANAVYSMFLHENDVEELDYSPVAIGYTKFFEKEINVSIVQSIRKDLGINMPKFFNKYCPVGGTYEVKINDKFKIDYNMKNMKTGSYLAPGLGQTFHALEVEIGNIEGDSNKLNELLSKGRKLNNIRNRAAHPELISKDDLDKIRDIILKLYLYKVFDELITTKKKLSN